MDAVEVWRPSPVRPDRYEVSSLGRIRSNWAGGRVLRPYAHPKSGHLMVKVVGDSGRQRGHYVHRLVAGAFVDGSGPVVRHLDGDPTNNLPANLAWGTQAENIHDAIRQGTHAGVAKTHCKHGHSLADAYRYGNTRVCRQCQAARTARWKGKKS